MKKPKKILMLFTNSYPYGTGEPFLETEINFLSKSFDLVYIFSFESDKNNSRRLPKNVVSYSLNLKKMKFKLFRKLLNGIVCKKIRFLDEGFRKRMIFDYFKGGANIGYRKVKKIINHDIKIDSSCFVVLYSYWIGDESTIASFVKKDLLKKNIKTRFVSRCHGTDVYSERHRLNYLPLQKNTVIQCDCIATCSLDGLKYLTNKYPDYSHKFLISRLGTLDFGVFTIDNKQNPIRFVTCSNIIPLKNLSFFARVFCALSTTFNVEWHCIGSGPDVENIKSVLDANHCLSKVKFYGRLENEKVLSLYSNYPFHFFVNTSFFEGVPVSIMEAMSFGMPIIATDVGGTSEIVNNSNGLLLDKNSTVEEAYYKISDELTAGNYLAKRINSRRQWEKMCDAKSNYSKFIEEVLL